VIDSLYDWIQTRFGTVVIVLLLPAAALVIPLGAAVVSRFRQPRTMVHIQTARVNFDQHRGRLEVVIVAAIGHPVLGATVRPVGECVVSIGKVPVELTQFKVDRDKINPTLPDYGIWFEGKTGLSVSRGDRVKVRIRVSAPPRGHATKTAWLVVGEHNVRI